MGKIFIALVVVFLLGGAIAVWQATRDTAAHVLTVQQLSEQKGDRERLRVGGTVSSKQAIDYRLEPKIELRFSLEDKEHSGAVMPVVYHGAKPDMFAVGRDVIVDGDLRAGTFVATQLLTQCPSKYEVPTSPQKSENSKE